MKSTSVLTVTLIVVLCSVHIYSQTSPTSGHGDDSGSSEIWEKVKKIRADLQKMKADDKFDDQKLIADAQSLVKLVQAELKNCPPSLQAQLSSEVTAIQTKITQMSNSGKFEPSILQLFMGIVKAVSAEKRQEKPSASKNATNTS